MKRFFSRNLDRKGRIARAAMGLGLVAGAAFAWGQAPALGALLAAAGLFGLFEAIRGWCLLRACGVKTRL